jgi:hypothetical protein
MDGQRDGGKEEPTPSDSQDEGEGLLGGDLFKPSNEPRQEDKPSQSGSGSSPGKSDSPGGKPEITLPPIVPEVLPGLGLDDGS